jgi:hypothetical protein
MTLQTQIKFTLPRGYLDPAGQVHREGTMRLATALDEIEAAGDPRLRANEAYLPVVLLSRVITQLGELPFVTPQVVADLFASDLVYLEDLYLRLNTCQDILLNAVCPACSTLFKVRAAPLEGG